MHDDLNSLIIYYTVINLVLTVLAALRATDGCYNIYCYFRIRSIKHKTMNELQLEGRQNDNEHVAEKSETATPLLNCCLLREV